MELPVLVADGQFYRVATTGEPFTVIGTSGLNLPGLLSDQGEAAVDEMAHQRQELGFNYQRCFTDYDLPARPPLFQPIGRFLIAEHPEAYDYTFPALGEILARRGQRINFVATAGSSYRPDHLSKLAACLKKQATVSRVNEGDRVGNDPGGPVWSGVSGLICSQGSNSSDSFPPEPALDEVEYHIIGSEFQRKVGHNTMEVSDHYRRPGVCTETPRAGDHYTDSYLAYDAARAAALLCAGSFVHSIHGKDCGLFVGNELECARAWAEGAKSVPLEFQRGRYVHRTDLESDTIIRAYSRVLPDGREYVVTIRA